MMVAAAMSFAFLIASAAALRPWVAQWGAHRAPLDRATRIALSIDPGSDRLQVILANLYQYDLFLRDYRAALTSYQTVLRLNPLDSASWLHLGKLYQKLDRPREADRALRFATQIAPSDSTILWETTLAYVEEGQLTSALHMLGRFIAVSGDDGSRTKGYELARLLAPPEQVLQSVIAPSVSSHTQYMTYLLDGKLEEDAFRVWGRLNEMTSRVHEQIDSKLQLRVVDLLIEKGEFGPAYDLWSSLMNVMNPRPPEGRSNLISNGSFERRDTLGKGFDWKIGGAPGIACELDTSMAHTGRQSLRLPFGKSEAQATNVSQLIPVQADATYLLEAHIRTRGLDGSQGVHLEVTDQVSGPLARTQTVAEARDWTKVGVTFRTPANSRAVTLRVRIAPPTLSIPLTGATAWIDDVSISKAD